MVTFELFGKPFEVLGYKGFFLAGDANDASVLTMFLFQMVFMDTAATIPTGAMAERWKFSAFMVFGFFLSMVIYPVYGCWVWGGGWLADLGVNFGIGNGHIDFAGSSVVHMTGGVTALAGALVLGPRIGKFNKDGSANAIPGHNIPMVVLGTLILAFGWFGFNAGSTLAATDRRIASIAVCTMLATAAGCLTSLLYMWAVFGKPDPTMACNGLLAGAVAITAPCAFVNPIGAVIIGGHRRRPGDLERPVRREGAQGRRPRRCGQRPRRLRRVRLPLHRPLRRRQVRRGLERRRRQDPAPACSTAAASASSSAQVDRRRGQHPLGLPGRACSSSSIVEKTMGNRVPRQGRDRRPGHPRDGRPRLRQRGPDPRPDHRPRSTSTTHGPGVPTKAPQERAASESRRAAHRSRRTRPSA